MRTVLLSGMFSLVSSSQALANPDWPDFRKCLHGWITLRKQQSFCDGMQTICEDFVAAEKHRNNFQYERCLNFFAERCPVNYHDEEKLFRECPLRKKEATK